MSQRSSSTIHPRVLVIGEDTRSFLTVIRSLGRAGYIVDAVCFDRTSPALLSRYLHQVRFFNHQSMTADEWLQAVLQWIHAEQYDAVVPCDERALFPLLQHRAQLPESTHLAAVNDDAVTPLFDKDRTRELARACDVPVAAGERLRLAKHTYEALVARWGVPLVIKPLQSFTLTHLNARQSVSIVHNAKDFSRLQQRHPETEYLVESYFKGHGEGISVLADAGDVTACFAHRRVVEPASGGGSTYRVSVEVRHDMRAAVERMCKACQLDGVAMFEFKCNRETGAWILIEVNARLWGSIPLALFAGVDFPRLWVEQLLGSSSDTVLSSYRTPVYARALTSDLYEIKRELELESGGTIARTRLLAHRLWPVLGRPLLGRETVDSFAWRDWRPFVAEVNGLVQALTERPLARIKPLAMHQRFKRVQQIRRQLRQQPPRRLVFICYGNIMRSPFAAAYFTQRASQFGVEMPVVSMGFHREENRACPEECVRVARQFGVDLTTHRSRCLWQNALQEGDWIIDFDASHRERLQRYFSVPMRLCAADLLPDHLWCLRDIADPFGGGDAAVQTCYRRIVEAMDSWLAEMSEAASQG